MSFVDFIKVQTPEHIAATALMANLIWHEHYDPIVGLAQVDYMLDKFQSEKAIESQIARGWLYYLLCDDGRLIGYIGLEPQPEKDALLLSKYYIYKEHRGKGYGRQCMDFVESVCREMEFQTLWLTVNKNNTDTIKIYEKLGFEKHGEIVADIGSGFVMDDYRMVKGIRGKE